MRSDADRLVHDHDVVVVEDDAQAGDDLRRGGDRRRWRVGQLDLEPLALAETVALADVAPVDGHSSGGRQLGGARTAEAEEPCQAGVDAFALESLGHGQRAYVSHRAERRRPSNSMPMIDSTTIPIAEQVMALSARLKTAKCCGWMKSTTWPWKGCGARKIRSVRLPTAPPRRPPRQTAQALDPRWRLVRTMTTATATAMRVKTHVVPVPSEKAAPGLRVYVIVSQLPMTWMSSRDGMSWTMRSLLSWSTTQTTSATTSTSGVRFRVGRTGSASSGAALAPGSAVGSVDMRCPGSHGSAWPTYLLATLLALLVLHAERRPRECLQSTFADGVAADLAHAVRA